MSLREDFREGDAGGLGVCDGSSVKPLMGEQYLARALFLLEEGATRVKGDRALETWGMAMGPVRMADLGGQTDIGWAIRQSGGYRERPPNSSTRKKSATGCAKQGCRFGQKRPDGLVPIRGPAVATRFRIPPSSEIRSTTRKGDSERQRRRDRR